MVERRQLSAILVDYLDGDNVSRPNGREERGSILAIIWRRPGELARIEEWNEVIERNARLVSQCSSTIAKLNINAVPADLWQLFWPQSLESVLRAEIGVSGLFEMQIVLGLSLRVKRS